MLVEDGAVSIEVTDTGRGMSEPPRLAWDPEALHEQGMGLTIVRSVVDETDVTRLLTLVCERLRELTNARLALAALPSDSSDGSAASAPPAWACS